MSAHPVLIPQVAPTSPDVLGELLHSLSQPLTALHCSLELSYDEVVEQQRTAISSALEQTDRVMAVLKVMREYLDVDRKPLPPQPVELMPALRAVIDALSVLAEARQVRIELKGVCDGVIRAPEFRVHRALYYLIAALVETQPEGGAVIIDVHESAAGWVLHARGKKMSRGRLGQVQADGKGPRRIDPVADTLRRTRIAIARRVLEPAGIAVYFEEGRRPSLSLRSVKPEGIVKVG